MTKDDWTLFLMFMCFLAMIVALLSLFAVGRSTL